MSKEILESKSRIAKLKKRILNGNIITCAAKGRLAEFERIYQENKDRLTLRDKQGRYAVHHAARNGQVAILDFIHKNNGDLDVQDNQGNTPLHAAVEGGHKLAVDFLLASKADPSILNKEEMAPLHQAVFGNKILVLDVMLSYPEVDVNLKSRQGATPLHIAAFKDNHECAKRLLDNGASMCTPCRIGLMPIHLAARKAATKTLNILLEFAESKGCGTRSEILRMADNSNNMPLHSAITSGDITSVRTLLDAGASIIDTMQDQSNAVHMACAVGNLEMLKLMFGAQPDYVITSLSARDVTKMTPLHKAALFDRADCVKYVIEQGADMDAEDIDCRSPVLVAASCKAWNAVNILLHSGASSDVKDKHSRNMLHLLISNGGKLALVELTQCKNFKQLLNEQDDLGCTPLHYASKEGHLKAIDNLIHMGAIINPKNNKHESPLHFAARYGRLNTCRRFLASLNGQSAINESDYNGQSSLHLAAKEGHTRVVQLFLAKGATILKDKNGDTCLHLAAANGYTDTMRNILTVHAHLINAQNKAGDTPLHLAAINGHSSSVSLLLTKGAEVNKNNDGIIFFDFAIQQEQKDVCIAIVTHDRWKECLLTSSVMFDCPAIGLIRHLPDVYQIVLDRCKTPSGVDKKDKDFHYTYDFAFLQIPLNKLREFRAEGKEPMPLFALNKMVQYNRVDVLSHPVCVTFLQMKWRAYGLAIHLINVLIYMMYLTSLTVFIGLYDFSATSNHSTSTTSDSYTTSQGTAYHELSTIQRMTVIVVTAFCILNIIKEIFQMLQQRLKYFMDLNNLLEWVLYLSSGFFIGPFLVGNSTSWQWQCGTIAAFLAWFNFLLFLQRFDFYGIYVVMFLEILKTLIQALIVFSILLVAFALAFYIILSREVTNAYRDPLVSLMTTTVMMTGTIDYIETWVDPLYDSNDSTLQFSLLAYIMLGLFIILMPILLMNLLIGLAVGDIEAVQKDARLKRLAMQVELHTDLERKLPTRLLECVDKPTYKVYPNSSHYLFVKIWNQLTKTRGISLDQECNDDMDGYIYQELYTQKKRLKTISGNVDKVYDLMRLVVQKMEIKTEADDVDEAETRDFVNLIKSASHKNSWSNPALRHTLLKQADTLNRWKSIDN